MLSLLLLLCVLCRLPPPPEPAQLSAVVKALKGAKKPVSEGGESEGGMCGGERGMHLGGGGCEVMEGGEASVSGMQWIGWVLVFSALLAVNFNNLGTCLLIVTAGCWHFR